MLSRKTNPIYVWRVLSFFLKTKLNIAIKKIKKTKKKLVFNIRSVSNQKRSTKKYSKSYLIDFTITANPKLHWLHMWHFISFPLLTWLSFVTANLKHQPSLQVAALIEYVLSWKIIKLTKLIHLNVQFSFNLLSFAYVSGFTINLTHRWINGIRSL